MRKEKAIFILNKIKGKKVLVIGDVMLDEYLWGKVERISPEAPVPVVKVVKQSFSLGGASNVAQNLYALGAQPLLVGVVGSDDAGRNFKALLKENGMSNRGIFIDRERTTIVKKRVVAHHQQVVRVDIEETKDIERIIEERILKFLDKITFDFSAIIIEDYNKGLLTKRLIQKVIVLAHKKKVPVTVDPKFENFFVYKNITLFKPNVRELERVTGKTLTGKHLIETTLRRLQQKIKTKAILLTMGEKGMVLVEKGKKPFYLEPHALDVYDVTGAGDTVIAAVTLAMIAGCSMKDSMRFASAAAALEVTKLGATPVIPEEIIRFCKREK